MLATNKRGPRSKFMETTAPRLTAFISQYQNQLGAAPSLSIIATEFGVSREMARKYLDRLEALGIAQREFANSRRVKFIHFTKTAM